MKIIDKRIEERGNVFGLEIHLAKKCSFHTILKRGMTKILPNDLEIITAGRRSCTSSKIIRTSLYKPKLFLAIFNE